MAGRLTTREMELRVQPIIAYLNLCPNTVMKRDFGRGMYVFDSKHGICYQTAQGSMYSVFSADANQEDYQRINAILKFMKETLIY